MNNKNFSDYASLTEAAELTKYDLSHLARLCRAAGADNSVIPKDGVMKISGRWWIHRSVLPQLIELSAERERGEGDGTVFLSEIAELLGVSRQRAAKILSDPKKPVPKLQKDSRGRLYAQKKDIERFAQLREGNKVSK